MFLDSFPVARGGGVDWGAFEYGGGHAVAEGAVDDVGVAGDPTNVGHAGEFVIVVDVKDVFEGERSAEEVTTCSVHNALGFSGRSGGIEDEEGIFGSHDFGGTVSGY